MYTMDPHTIAQNHEYYKSLKINNTTDAQVLQDEGLMQLLPGQAIFWRAPGSTCALDDQLITWVFDREILCKLDKSTTSYIDELERMSGDIAGDGDQLNAQKKKGCAFERDGRAKANLQGGRCYPTSTSKEKQKGLFHPCKNVQFYAENYAGEKKDISLDLRRDLNFVSFKYLFSCSLHLILHSLGVLWSLLRMRMLRQLPLLLND